MRTNGLIYLIKSVTNVRNLEVERYARKKNEPLGHKTGNRKKHGPDNDGRKNSRGTQKKTLGIRNRQDSRRIASK